MTAEPTDAERAFVMEYLAKKEATDNARLRASHDRLLAAAKNTLASICACAHLYPSDPIYRGLKAAVAKAEELET